MTAVQAKLAKPYLITIGALNRWAVTSRTTLLSRGGGIINRDGTEFLGNLAKMKAENRESYR